jgi:hypothetical protein
VGEQPVEFDLAKHGTQCGLRKLRGLVDVVGDLDDGPGGVETRKRDDRIDLQRDVVAGDDVLRRNFEDFLAERDPDDLIERAKDEDDTRPFGLRQHLAEPEDDAALIFAKNNDRAKEIQDKDDKEDQYRDATHGGAFLRLCYSGERVGLCAG